EDRCHGVPDAHFVADVAGVGGGGATVLGDLGRNGSEFLGPAAHQGHGSAQARKLVRRAAAYAAAAARDDDDLAGKQIAGEDRPITQAPTAFLAADVGLCLTRHSSGFPPGSPKTVAKAGAPPAPGGRRRRRSLSAFPSACRRRHGGCPRASGPWRRALPATAAA